MTRVVQDWLTGTSTRPAEMPRTVVVEDARAVPVLVSTEVIGPDTVVVTRERQQGGDQPSGARWLEFSGSFDADDDELRFSDGAWMHNRRYKMAEFCCLDLPTVLRIADATDFSAFLRDADRAWNAGVFAGYATHPFAIITDLAALGGRIAAAGPRHRLYVADTGAIRTSPAGRVLGQVGDLVADVRRRWREFNLASRRPDAVCLAGVLSEADRVDALDERPWLGRYLEVLEVIRAVRRTDRMPDAVSGFGGRLLSGGRSPVADPIGSPVLLRVRDVLLVRDTGADLEVTLTPDQLIALELWLDDPTRLGAELDSTLALAAAAGITGFDALPEGSA